MKRFFSVICFFFMMALPMNAQSESSTKVYYEVDEMPSFPGGLNGLMTFLAQNMVYPVTAQENGVQGRVTVSFVVETDGSITDVEVARSVDPFLDREKLCV